MNCYRMFAELREALEGDRALDEGERFDMYIYLTVSMLPNYKKKFNEKF